jgi:hypothetical protein
MFRSALQHHTLPITCIKSALNELLRIMASMFSKIANLHYLARAKICTVSGVATP